MEPIVHAIIPLLFLLAFFPDLDKKYLLLLPIVWIIDLDSYIGAHRFWFHNLFFILIFSFLLWWLWDKKAFFITLFFGLSHIILDLTMPGTAFLYPLIQKTFYLSINISLFPFSYNLGFNSLSLNEYASLSSLFESSNYFGEMSFMLFLIFVILLFVKYRKVIFKK